MKPITILGIESSCDETGVAIIKATALKSGFKLTVTDHLLHTQIALHAQTGGVVPEVAAREHAVRLPQILHSLGEKYGHKKLARMVDGVAVTNGPGLVTSLLVGASAAQTIAYAWQKPLIPVNHLEGHIYANLIHGSQNKKGAGLNFKFPLLVLMVSGGHTELVLMTDHLKYKIVGSTLDDAVGEAFDKSAKLLGLPYPGGPALSKLATQGNRQAISFPRPMLDRPNLDFSFSGIKTAVAVYLQKNPQANIKDVAASFEQAVVETLVGKTMCAVKKYKPQAVAIAGGVSANTWLRHNLRETVNNYGGVEFMEPNMNYATDNGAMIAAAGAFRFWHGKKLAWSKLKVDPNLPLK